MNNTFNGRLRPKRDQPVNWSELTDLSNEKLAFIYQRLSTHEQMRKSIYSIKAQDALYELAREDGYPDDQIYIERRDLGISGTKGREERQGLAYLIKLVEDGLVEAVYVAHISRLYRDQTLINAFALGELFKEHNVIIVTPQMRLNLRDKMHMRLYRMEVERAADELELMANRLYGARIIKAKAGYYTGESIPAGYVLNQHKDLNDNDCASAPYGYRIHDPHAEVVRVIFNQLAIPGTTPTRVARYCKSKGIAFEAFPSDLDIEANRKAFLKTKRNPDGSWPVTVSRTRSIATNPAYIGWKLWGGEVVSKNAFPPIIDENIFWTVQERFKKHPSPKKDLDPLPLAGLLHCGNHDIPRPMHYNNRSEEGTQSSKYSCSNSAMKLTCAIVADHILDSPISEAVISQIALPGLVEQILSKLTSDYEQAKEQVASYSREMKRLRSEVENLQDNLTNGMAKGILSDESVKAIDIQIQNRLARIQELADLNKQPIGAAIGESIPGQADVELVQSFLENLGENWINQPNGLKNAFLRLLLDKIIIWPHPTTIRAKLFWRVGLEQELLIHRPPVKYKPWHEAEVEILRQHYATASKGVLLALLPNRTWISIRSKVVRLGLVRNDEVKRTGQGKSYSDEEDRLIRRFYAGEISRDEITAMTGRKLHNLRRRARQLGLKYYPPKATWEWLKEECKTESEGPSPPRYRPRSAR